MTNIDWTQPVETDEDPPRPVRVLCTDAGGAFPIVITLGKGAISLTENGFRGTGSRKPFVRNVPEPAPVLHEIWVNLYADGCVSPAWKTEDAAKKYTLGYSKSPLVETRCITWMDDGSPVLGENKGTISELEPQLADMTADRDRLQTQVDAMKPVVDAAANWCRWFYDDGPNKPGLGDTLAKSVRVYLAAQKPKADPCADRTDSADYPGHDYREWEPKS